MSALKVFISSTCYDLANVREELRKFIINFGYEPIMSEYSDVLYDPREHTHTSCVEEVKNCDMVILIIGGRFGGKAIDEAISKIDFNKIEKVVQIKKNDNFSITYLEFLKAIECEIPVYTFIQEDVLSDHKLYEKNKDNEIINLIKFPSIEKQETARYIFEFINAVRKRNRGNNIFPFGRINDIEEILKKQWASLFQKLLKEKIIQEKDENSERLERKVDELTEIISKLIKEESRENYSQLKAHKKQGKVLWVDDYPINNEAIINFFKEKNVHFDIALTTEQGLKLYKKELYDLIITDMGRGDESDAGLTLIKNLKFLHCQVPIVVFCSWSAKQRYGQEAIKLGARNVTNRTADIIALLTESFGLSS